MIDEGKNVVYEAKMLKKPILGPMIYMFTNHVTGEKTIHEVGKILTTEQSGVTGFLATKSHFIFDGENIWRFLHVNGIRIKTELSGGSLSLTYDVKRRGNPFAKISTASRTGSGIVTGCLWYYVTCEEDALDLAFLTAFAFARTDQALYD